MSRIDPDKLKKEVVLWADEVGRRQAQYKLIRQGLSFSLAYQLTTGTYPSEVKERVIEAIQKAMPE